MSQQGSFEDLMKRLCAGEEQAAVELFELYAQRLKGLARSRMDHWLRQKESSQDVVQSVFRSFFGGQADGRLRPSCWQSLWRLLTVMTLRKCGHRMARFRTAKRGPEIGAEGIEDWQALAKEPTPAEAAILVETVQQLMDGFNQRDRQLFELSLQGNSAEEISGRVGCSERTVQRVLQRLEDKLERELAGP